MSIIDVNKRESLGVQGTAEGLRVTVSTVVQGLATGVIDVGEHTPIVAPIFVALRCSKKVVDGAQRNKDDLEELQMLCTVLTAQVIEKCSSGKTMAIDVTPLIRCVRKLEMVAGRYSGRGFLSRMANFRRDGDDIRRLRNRIRDVVPILGLAATTHVSDQLEKMQNLLEEAFRERQIAQSNRSAAGSWLSGASPWWWSTRSAKSMFGQEGARVWTMAVTCSGLLVLCTVLARKRVASN